MSKPDPAQHLVEFGGVALDRWKINGRRFQVSRPSACKCRCPVMVRPDRRASLTHRDVRNLVLERGDGGVLIEGRDYTPDLADGSVVFSSQVLPGLAEASFHAQQSRYDAIWVDPSSAEVGLTQGPERGIDVVDHMPVVAPPRMRLVSLHVTAEDVAVIETWRSPDIRWVETCRERLPRLMGLLSAGAPIRLVGYGTSVTAIGGPMPTHYIVPNGPHRDILDGYFTNGGTSRLAPDTIEAIPRFDHGLGADHVHVGFNWELASALGRRSPVTYLNMSISGTEAGGRERPNGRPDGGNPRRLAAATALQPDVVVLEYVINDLHSPELVDNLAFMIEAFQRHGAEVIVLGCPGFTNYRSDEQRRYGEASAEAAAERTGAAFVPLAPIVEGVTGMAPRTLGSASGLHHPGPTELMAYGQWLARIVP